jgi:phospholipid/cholesterol/gamma-HCH transport system ATP-binding protein
MAAEPGDVVIALEGVEKRFGSNRVLRGVDLSIRDGETFTILGGSGSGKSVCLKHMTGLLRPDAGRVVVFGTDITHLPERKLVPIRTAASMIFQSAALFDSLSVYENVAYPLREHHRWPEAQLRERVQECLAAVGLEGVEERLPAELSGGMRKRVGVARGIALEPRVILYDEPTTGLDPANQRRVGNLIRSLQERLRVTSVVVTHELELCFDISDRVALLKEGRIVADGSAAAMQSSDHPDVRAFLDGTRDLSDMEEGS